MIFKLNIYNSTYREIGGPSSTVVVSGLFKNIYLGLIFVGKGSCIAHNYICKTLAACPNTVLAVLRILYVKTKA